MRDLVELELKLHSSNAAFFDEEGNEDPILAAKETARILREVAADIEVGTTYCEGNLRDANGNTVGSFLYEFTPEEEA
jgi:hypothetical protein